MSSVSMTERISAIAATALTTPSRAKAGNSRKDAISRVSGRMKAGKSPKYMRLTMVPVTPAMTMGAKAERA